MAHSNFESLALLWGDIEGQIRNSTPDYIALTGRWLSLSEFLAHGLLEDTHLRWLTGQVLSESALDFLLKHVLKKEWTEMHVAALGVISDYLLNQAVSADQASLIQKYALFLVSSAPSSRSRVGGLVLLKGLIQVCVGPDWSDRLQVSATIQKLLTILSQGPSKTTSNLVKYLNITLGTFCRTHTSELSHFKESLLHNLLEQLRRQTGSAVRSPDLTVIEGVLLGLDDYLTAFGLSSDDQTAEYEQLYDCLRRVCPKGEDEKRWTARRAGVVVMGHHCQVFRAYVTEDIEFWYEELYRWAFARNRDDHRAGYPAMLSLLQVVGDHLAEKPNMRCINFLLEKFKTILRQKDYSHGKVTAFAIQGYGHLARACQKVLPEEDVRKMLFELIRRTEEVFFNPTMQLSEVEERFVHLSSYVDALSHIVLATTDLPPACQVLFEKIVVYLIKQYPKIPKPFQKFAEQSVSKALEVVRRQNGSRDDDFLSEIIFRGILESCSYPVVTKLDEGLIDGAPPTSVTSFSTLWVHLASEKGSQIPQVIYDHFVKCSLKIFSKLNLSFTSLEEDPSEPNDLENAIDSDIDEIDPAPTSVKDITVLANLVTLMTSTLTSTNPARFLPWCEEVLSQIMAQSLRNPEISSVYRCLSLAISLGNQSGLFQQSFSDQLKESLTKFCWQLCLVIPDYEEELLDSCLELIIALPACVVTTLQGVLQHPLRLIFGIAKTDLALAEKAIQSFEIWLKELGKEEGSLMFRPLIVSLNKFLIENRMETFSDDTLNDEIKGLSAKSRAKKKSKKLPDGLEIGSDTQLQRLQKKILLFIGKLSSETLQSLIPDKSDVGSKVIRWNEGHILPFSMPFPDKRVDIFLDDLFPRVLSLALDASSRKTRVAATESLHTLSVFMIGKSATSTNDLKKSRPLIPIFEKLFPAFVVLSCDRDVVIKDLFKPLLFQCIHWFTRNSKEEQPETILLLDAIMDGLTYEGNAMVRKESAKYLNEFLKWSIKQTPKQEMLKKIHNPKALFLRLYSFWLHPNPMKRQGASLAFNHLYRTFREESVLAREFTFEILIHVMKSLMQTREDLSSLSDSTAVLDMASQSLKHLARIIKEKHRQWSADETSVRNVPKDLKGPNLDDLLSWLASIAFQINEDARHKAIELIELLAEGKLQKLKCLQQALGHKNIDEASAQHLDQDCTFNDLLEMDFRQIKIWLNQAVRSVECYSWMIHVSLIDESAPFMSKYLLENIQVALHGFVHLSKLKAKFPLTDYHMLEKRLGCLVLQIFAFVRNFSKKSHIQTIWTDQMWPAILKATLTPSEMGFNVNKKSLLELEQTLERLLLFAKRQGMLFQGVFSNIPEELHPENVVSTSLKETLNSTCKHALTGYQLLANTGHVTFWQGKLPELIRNCVEPEELSFNAPVLEFYFALANQNDEELNSCLEALELHLKKQFVTRVWIRNVNKKNLTRIFKRIVKRYAGDQCFLLSLVLRLCQEMNRRLSLNPKEPNMGVVQNVFEHWSILSAQSESSQNQDIMLSLVFIFRRLMPMNETDLAKSSPFHKFVASNLSSKVLDLKSKALLLDFLVILIDQEDDFDLSQTLDDFANSSFPLSSLEYEINSFEGQTYLECIQKLASIFISTGSTKVLTFLIGIVVREESHRGANDIENQISLNLHQLESRKQEGLLLETFAYLQEDRKCPCAVRLRVLETFLIPLLLGSRDVAIVNFCVKRIRDFLETFFLPMSGMEEKRIDVLVTKITVFKILGAVYGKLSMEKVHSSSSEIAKTAFPFLKIKKQVKEGANMTGKEMSIFLVRMLQSVKSEIMDGSEQLKEYFRNYHCSAYNAMMSVISCVQTEDKFFKNYIFKEAVSKSELIWSRIVDANKVYHFPIETDTFQPMKAKLVAIRKIKQSSGSETQSQNFFGTSLESHYLSDSSMSQAITSYDFTQSSVTLNAKPRTNSNVNASSNEEEKSNYVTLESDDMNSHECMAPLVGTMTYLLDIKKVPTEASDLPEWLECVVEAASDTSQSKNARMFLLKLLWNCRDNLEPYQKTLGRYLLPILAKESLWTNDAKLNSVWLDLMSLVALWAPELTPKESEMNLKACTVVLVDLLARFAIENENREVVKHLLELMKTFVQSLHSVLRACSDELFTQFQSHPKKRPVVVQIIGIFLSHGLDPVPEGALVDFSKFWSTVLSQLEQVGKSQYVQMAQTVGLGLKFYQGSKNYSRFFALVEDRLNSITSGGSQANSSRFLVCLYHCQTWVPEICHNYYRKYIYSLSKKAGEELIFGLEIIAACAPDLGKSPNDIPKELNLIGIKGFLRHFDGQVQARALKILTKLLPFMEPQLILEYVELCQNFSNHAIDLVRKLRLELAQESYLLAKTHPRDGSSWNRVHKMAIQMITEALGDWQGTIVSQAIEFLDLKSDLSQDTCVRLATLFQDFVTESSQQNFLPNATNLMFLLCHRSPEMDRKLFSDPLSDQVHFQEQIINTSWRYQTQESKIPRFVETLSQSQTTEGYYIRATQQTMEFEQTQMASGSTQSISSPESRNDELNSTKGQPNRPSASSLRPKRFQTSQNNESEYERAKSRFARIHFRSQEKEAQSKMDAQGQRSAGVTLVRKYRTGELPDIQISAGDVIKAINNLVKRDEQMARSMLCTLIKAIVVAGAPDTFTDSLKNALVDILSRLQLEDRFLTSAILELVSTLNPSGIPIAQVSLIARSLHLEGLGILTLENQLRSMDDRTPARKKIRQMEVAFSQDDLNIYGKLMELYRGLAQEDSVRGIGAQFFSDQKLFSKALNHESLQHFEPASEIYSQLKQAHQDSEAMNQVYREFYLESLEKMSKWDVLEKETLAIVDGEPVRLVDSEWAQLRVLPKFIEASLFQISEGKSKANALFKLMDNKSSVNNLRERFGLNFSLAYLMKKQFIDAEMVVKQTLDKYLHDWSNMDGFSVPQMISNLHQLKRLSQIDELLHSKPNMSSSKPHQLSQLESLQHLDILIRDKRIALKALHKNEKRHTILARDYENGCQEALARQSWIEAVRWLALWQNSDTNKQDQSRIQAMIGKVTVAKCLGATYKSLGDRINALYRTGLMGLEKRNTELDHDEYVMARTDMLKSLDQLLSELPASTTLKEVHDLLTKQDKIDHFKLLVKNPKNLKDFKQRLMMANIESFNSITHDDVDRNLVLAGMCHKLVKSFGTTGLSSSLTSILFQSHLKAMKNGSIKAAQLFPNLLEHLENTMDTDSNADQVFQDEAEQVPSWCYLMWSNQLVSFLGTAISAFVEPIILRIAQDYPLAVQHAFQMFQDNKRFTKIDSLLQSEPVQSQIMEALSHLCIPYLPLLDTISSSKNQRSPAGKTMIVNEVKNFLARIKTDKNMFGRLYQKMQNESQDVLRDLEKASQPRVVVEKVREKMRRLHTSKLLEDYVPFLASYHMCDHAEQVEIPGQYQKFQKPNPEDIVRICYFEKAVQPFSSLRKPIKFTIVGDNGKRYDFIAKCGEDLRQDERIEQLFKLCNDIFQGSSQLHIRTYNVLPLSTSCGLIECVPNISPYKALAQKTNPLGIGCSTPDDFKKVIKMSAKSRKDAFLTGTQSLDHSIFSQSLRELSISPEGFFFMRDNFIRTHATHSVVGWLLSIGDRHADNLLISKITGESIPIDFGYAFGVTAHLPIIELVPFRLTPQMQELMKPFARHGPIREVMIRALQMVKDNSEAFISALRVFSREPTLDWVDNAAREASFSSGSSGGKDDSIQFYPERKVEIVERKLSGDHPSLVATDEVSHGRYRDKAQIECMRNVLLGEAESKRNCLASSGVLSTEEQVDCLLEAATDPSILRCAFVGWAPYI